MKPTDGAKVGVLLDDDTVQQWEARTLAHLENTTSAEITTVIINSKQDGGGSQLRSLLFEPSLWKIFNAARFAAHSATSQPWYQKIVSIDEIPSLKSASQHYCKPIKLDGLGNELPERAIDELRATDVAIRFGFGIIVGDVLSAPEYGVLSYHHGNLRNYRGKPAGFYEFIHSEDTAGVTVQRLNETLDGGEIAAYTDVDIQDAKSWPEVMDRQFRKSPPLVAEAIETAINNPGRMKMPDQLGTVYSSPTDSDMAKYLIERVSRIA
jgi:methionyl-tRNA formyltransferase